nr:choice-of-anchor D domain-containing protein [Terriglobales bacterium]
MHRKITQTTHLIIGFTLSLAFALTAHAATGAVTISPTTYNFGNETVGLKSPALTVTVTNTGAKAVNVTSFQLTNSAFQLTQGIAPTKISPNGAVTYYVVLFAPIAAQTSSGTLTVNIDNGQRLTVSLKGGGTTTTAKASLT